jgi:hypothetical protein
MGVVNEVIVARDIMALGLAVYLDRREEVRSVALWILDEWRSACGCIGVFASELSSISLIRSIFRGESPVVDRSTS